MCLGGWERRGRSGEIERVGGRSVSGDEDCEEVDSGSAICEARGLRFRGIPTLGAETLACV
jgi:hypothetical protein